jgi:hypothetical protein
MDQYGSRIISPNEKQDIDRALLRAFVMNGIAFQASNNPFLQEFVTKLNPMYRLPDRNKLSRVILTQEVVQVEKNNESLINEADHLTLNLDGWTDRCGRSLYEFNVITENRKAVVLSLLDVSVHSHTAPFIVDRVEAVLQRASTKCDIERKLRAIVTDNPNVMAKMRELFISKPDNRHILSFRCFAHAINLIAGEHLFLSPDLYSPINFLFIPLQEMLSSILMPFASCPK